MHLLDDRHVIGEVLVKRPILLAQRNEIDDHGALLPLDRTTLDEPLHGLLVFGDLRPRVVTKDLDRLFGGLAEHALVEG